MEFTVNKEIINKKGNVSGVLKAYLLNNITDLNDKETPIEICLDLKTETDSLGIILTKEEAINFGKKIIKLAQLTE